MSRKPTKAELNRRIAEHRAHWQDGDTSNLLWSGYLAALMEWGFLEPDDYHELRSELRLDGGQQLKDIFLGFDGEG